MGRKLKIAFMGTPDFACAALRRIHEAGHELVCVYSQPARPAGRGHRPRPCPVQAYAQAAGLPVCHPQSLQTPEFQAGFAAHNADIAVVAAYGLILPAAILAAPRWGCVNIHASLLPRWRGASPVQRAIQAGDRQSGITLMQMDKGVDTGPLITQRAVEITPRETALTLEERLAALGAAMIVETLDKLAATGRLPLRPQPAGGASYAKLLQKADGRIDWARRAGEIDRQIRAFNPRPGVWTMCGQQRLKILAAHPAPERAAVAGRQTPAPPPGTLIDRDGHVQCGGRTRIRLLTLQPAGKRAMDCNAALNGHYLRAGQVFA